MAVRVARGARRRPAVRVEVTRTPVRKGQVISSPMVSRPLSGRASSWSSAWPSGPTYRVNGARGGLVTEAL